MDIADLFPGCESFLVQEPEFTEEDKMESMLGIEEIANEVEVETLQNERLLASFDDFCNIGSHVAKFGIDRTFLSLVNKDNRLSRFLGTPLPSCESFDAIPRPDNNLTLIAMEGIGKSIGKFIDKIIGIVKAMAGWVKTKFLQFCKWVKSWFKSSKDKSKKVIMYWRDLKSGKLKFSDAMKKKKLPKVKTLGKPVFDVMKEVGNKMANATNIVSQTYKDEEPAKFLQTANEIASTLDKVKGMIKKEKVVLDFTNMVVRGDDVNYSLEDWFNTAMAVWNEIPRLEAEVDKTERTITMVIEWQNSWVTKFRNSKLNHFGDGTASKNLQDKVAATNKYRNAVTGFMNVCIKGVVNSVDTVCSALDKIASGADRSDMDNTSDLNVGSTKEKQDKNKLNDE